jgi:N-acetylmuramoyl-L-alanine amidase
MRQINLLVIHCSATKENRPFTIQALETSHRNRGFNGIGYHFYIRQSGEVINTRPLSRIGAHAKDTTERKPKDTRTPEQRTALRQLVNELLARFPGCKVCGHRDLSSDLNRNGKIEPREWMKQCPCFDVASEW